MNIKQVFSSYLLPCFTNNHWLPIDWKSYSNLKCGLTGIWGRSKLNLNKAAKRQKTADVQHGILMTVFVSFTLLLFQISKHSGCYLSISLCSFSDLTVRVHWKRSHKSYSKIPQPESSKVKSRLYFVFYQSTAHSTELSICLCHYMFSLLHII